MGVWPEAVRTGRAWRAGTGLPVGGAGASSGWRLRGSFALSCPVSLVGRSLGRRLVSVKCKGLGTRAGLVTYLRVGMAVPTCLRSLCPKLTPHLPAPLSVRSRAARASERRSRGPQPPRPAVRVSALLLGRLLAAQTVFAPGLARFFTKFVPLEHQLLPLGHHVEWPHCRHAGRKQGARPAAVLSCIHNPPGLGVDVDTPHRAPSPQPRWAACVMQSAGHGRRRESCVPSAAP